ncbi:MAG: hypothetical protein K0S33_255 [Bacteroidetes bacterium]|jgi:uncharacterized protein YqgV (UPF0045/DUF77 family)|nr:hypothetical protein [Bacteroidota bacterium]
MTNNIINLGIQVIPLRFEGDKYTIIDKAIHHIQQSGFPYRVTPFETVIEGPEDALHQLIADVRKLCYTGGCLELIINMRTHSASDKNILMNDKTQKFE